MTSYLVSPHLSPSPPRLSLLGVLSYLFRRILDNAHVTHTFEYTKTLLRIPDHNKGKIPNPFDSVSLQFIQWVSFTLASTVSLGPLALGLSQELVIQVDGLFHQCSMYVEEFIYSNCTFCRFLSSSRYSM